jgi:outer membrane protein OmpA-like peptidoglycan-associated protein
MAGRTPKSILMAVILWVIIIGGIAAAVRYFVLPKHQEKRRKVLALQTGSEGKYKHEVRLAADSFSGYCILRSSEMADRLGKQGIKFSVLDDGADYMKRIKALREGDVEMAVFPINSFIQCGAQLGEFPASIIYIVDETKGADAIVALKRSVPDISALNSSDARIVLTPDSPSEFLARVMIASFNLPDLSERKWMIKANGASEVFKKFRGASGSKRIAYAMWEPYVSKALREKDAHVLLDSSKLKGYIVDVLVARREFLIEDYEVAKEVLASYARTAYVNQGKMVDVVIADAKAAGDSIGKSDAVQMVKGIEWKNTLENYAHFGLQGDSHSLEDIEDIIIKITDVLIKTGALEEDPLNGAPNSLYFNKLVKDMKDDRFHPGREINVITSMDTGDSDERVREVRKLVKLTAAQWESLVTVGELRVKPITFGRGTSRISIQSEHELESLAGTLNSWPQYYLTVTGRVRPGGDAEAALQLAKARADATVQMLVAKGTAIEKIRSFAEIGASDSADAQSVSFVVGELPF